ncbi:MAG: LysM peptidoglycan-binding domain-containing protein [Spirochaetota bacterium]
MGTVTEGDTLVKLAEMQLKAETGSNKFTGEDVKKKVEQIKQINGLKSDTIQVGQNLLLGVSNERVVGEQGIQQSNIDLLLIGGAAYGLTKAGITGAGMIMDAALATDTGIKASLYGGLLASGVRAGLENGSL